MRVTGGSFRGRILKAPKGPPVRTTLDHVRQAIFHLIGPRVEGAGILDLFAGSGALGIEAISRGAAHATFVDKSSFSIQAIEANLERIHHSRLRTPSPLSSPPSRGRGGGEGETCVLRADAFSAIRRLAEEGKVFDLIFLDPPYGKDLATKSLKQISRYAILPAEGLVIAEHNKRDPLPNQLEAQELQFLLQDVKRYGDTALTIYQKQ